MALSLAASLNYLIFNLTLEGQFNPKLGQCQFLTFQIFLFYESVHHETFSRGTR
jgi:hypothetical protein